MIYFIFWVVFLAVIILSVPIVSWLEKRDRPAPLVAEDEPYVDESMGEELIADDAEAVEVAEEPVMADGGFGGDAFGGEEPVAFAEDFGGDDLFAEPGKD